MPAPVAASRAAKAARRLAPLALEAWRRWERLPEEEKERYRERVREYTTRGRRTMDRVREQRRRRAGGGGPPGPPGP